MLKQSFLRNFLGKRNVEMDQEPSSSGCSESDKSESSQKPALKKDRKFCDTCLTTKACLNPFTEGPYIKRWDPHFQ